MITNVKTEKSWVNIARCIGILLVIHVHTYGRNLNIVHWYESFHMSIFYFISGYLVNINYSFKTFLKKRIKRLVIPYYLSLPVVFAFLYLEAYIADKVVTGNPLPELLVKYLILYKPETEQWFFINLFLIEILGFFVFKYLLKIRYKILFTILMMSVGIGINLVSNNIYPFHIEKVFMLMPVYVAGYFYKQYEIRFKDNSLVKSILYFIGTISIWFIIEKTNKTFATVIFNIYGNYLLFYLGVILGVGFIVNISKVINHNTLMEKIGKESLFLCLTHRLVMLIPYGLVIYTIPDVCVKMPDVIAIIVMVITISLLLGWKNEYIVLKEKVKKKIKA